MNPLILSPSQFVGALNQTLELTIPIILIEGELSNYKISKNRWIYFDLKDEHSSVRFFGSVQNLPGKIVDGMKLKVLGNPRLSDKYGFSINVQAIEYSGEGTIRQAYENLKKQLEKEGLFGNDRKRPLPKMPQRIGLITSAESAAYADFIKIVSSRFAIVEIFLSDVLVQGIDSPKQIVEAVSDLNALKDPLDLLVICRGGGSADDLQAFNHQSVVRAIAASRTPTLVAIGHESDLTLAEMVADLRASTPSNAAEMAVPEKRELITKIDQDCVNMLGSLQNEFIMSQVSISDGINALYENLKLSLSQAGDKFRSVLKLISSLSPEATLKRGYTLAFSESGKIIGSSKKLPKHEQFTLKWHDGQKKIELAQKGVK